MCVIYICVCSKSKYWCKLLLIDAKNNINIAGAKSVDVDLKQQKVTVTGYVEPKKVLKAAQSTKKKVEMWPYVPYTLVANPYVAQAYDKKAPPNMVRKVPDTASATETTVDDRYTQMFSDENPNACSIM